ncbi:hypothetical protein [Shewanella sp. UCD-KL12]|uniref:hypothetical protein n=1 Tax=Shewanella sp. UCD-KL12 TaxID=1917163 RepID=UPI0009713AF4|nr:hypothetical protein [Shewanella sp. UCD-KL12]
MFTSISLRLSRHMSISHALSAAHFSRCAFTSEPTNKNLICANVSAAIFCSVAFIEASINEWAYNKQESIDQWLKEQPPKKKIKATDYKSFDRETIFTKYDIALQSQGQNRLNLGNTTAQHARALINLRNNLTHYKMDWLDTGSPEMLGSGSSFLSEYWPRMNLMVFGKSEEKGNWERKEYAEWAVISSIKFVDDFFLKLGEQSIVAHVKEDLKTR